jgi:hypothetical protein
MAIKVIYEKLPRSKKWKKVTCFIELDNVLGRQGGVPNEVVREGCTKNKSQKGTKDRV